MIRNVFNLARVPHAAHFIENMFFDEIVMVLILPPFRLSRKLV